MNIFFLKHSSVVRGNAHVERYIEYALERVQGVRLIPFDLVTEARNVKAPGPHTESEVLSRYGDYIIDRIRVLRPDIFLLINGYALQLQFPGFFERIKSLGVTTAAWHSDDPYYVDLQEAIAPQLDYVFTVDSSTVDFWRARVGHASFLPFGFAPESTDCLWAGRVRDSYASDVCFVGAPFAGSRRVRLISAQADLLSGVKTRIMGATSIDTWRRNLPRYDVLSDSVNDEFVEPADAARYYSAARINLNIHKDSAGHAWDRNRRAIVARSPNERVFAIGGTGAFQLIDNSRPDLEGIFPADALATFDAHDPQSLGDRVRHFLTHDREREEMAARLQALVLAEHTYDARIATLISRL